MKRFHLGSTALAATLVLLCRPTLAQNLVIAAAEIGITPESVVIAGCNPQQAAIILARLADAQTLRAELHGRRLVASEMVTSLSTLAQQLADAGQDQQILGQYQAAVQQLQLVKGQIQQLRVALFEVAIEGMPQTKVQRVVVWRKAARYRVAPEFRVRQRTVEEWRAIQRALRAERRGNRIERELAEDHAALLAQVRSDPAVIQASDRLATNLPAMKELFEQFSN